MYEYSRSILNDDYKGVSNGLFDGVKKYNKLWGPDFFIFTDMRMDEDEIEDEIDKVMFIWTLGE